MKQLSLVAFYKIKPKALIAFIEGCQKIVFDLLHDHFAPYDHRQVHATIIGLERIESDPAAINRNFVSKEKTPKAMDLHGFLTFLREQAPFPFTVQIGGFQPNNLPFKSRQKTPHERTFSVQGNKLVAMGWPVSQVVSTEQSQIVSLYPNTLDRIRRAAERFHIRHAYHQKSSDIDNDFFFRIGLIKQPEKLNFNEKALLESRVREYARTRPPLLVKVQLRDLSVAVYDDETLPPDTTQAFSLTDSRINGNFLINCYDF
jgi:hypothetical protein